MGDIINNIRKVWQTYCDIAIVSDKSVCGLKHFCSDDPEINYAWPGGSIPSTMSN